jgi:hypothetical protein
MPAAAEIPAAAAMSVFPLSLSTAFFSPVKTSEMFVQMFV